MENKSESTNRGLKVILGIAIALLFVAAFFIYKVQNESAANEKQLKEEKALVLKDLSSMAEQYDVAIGENEVANQKLVEARERIKGLIDSLKVSDNNVKSLWRYKKKYLALQEEMDVLLAENDSLKVENALLATTLDSTQLQLEERTMYNDSLLAQNTELAVLLKEQLSYLL